MLASNALLKITPGLMIWTLVCFFITFWVLKRYAFGPIQKALDERRERIRRSIEEAEQARNEARRQQDWARADAVRKQLSDAGIILEDRPDGTTRIRR